MNPSINVLSNPNSIQAIISFFEILLYNVIAFILFIILGKVTYLKDVLYNSTNYTKINSLFKIFLNERIDAQHRNGGDNDHRKFDLVGVLLGVSAHAFRPGSHSRSSFKRLIRKKDISQNRLQRLQVIAV